jgi:hypothetical protein
MKKKFSCGHEGKGQFCHRCKQLEQQSLEVAEAKLAARHAKAEMKAADAVDLSAINHLPALQNKARTILTAIAQGGDYRDFLGKRLISSNNEVIAVPLGYSHRLLFRDKPVRPISLVSHEQYNNLYASRLM